MKNTNQESKTKIIGFLSKHPNSDAKAIESGTSISRAVVFATMRELSEKKEVSVFQKNSKSVKLFSALSMPSVEKAKTAKKAEEAVPPVEKAKKAVKTKTVAKAEVKSKASAKAKPEVKAKTEKNVDTKSVEGKNHGRDFSKYMFNDMELRKGRLCHEVIKDVLTRKKATFKEAMEIFPPDSVRIYGPFAQLSVARKVNSTGPQRYNGKVTDHITLKCGTVICTTNQWSKHNFAPIIEIGRSNGCKITEPTV